MPRNGSGNYSLPEAAFVPGTTISSSAVNSDFSDIASAITDSIAADGQTPIVGQLKQDSGTLTTPPWSFTGDTTAGLYLAATGEVGLVAAGFGLLVDSNGATVATATPAAGGSGYALNDTITLTGGTSLRAAILTVASLTGSAVASVTVTDAGLYSTQASNPAAQGSTSGSGSGATFTLTWGTTGIFSDQAGAAIWQEAGATSYMAAAMALLNGLALANYIGAANIAAAVQTSLPLPSPQGYLTISTSTSEPVLLTDSTSATSLFFTPLNGVWTPAHNGTTLIPFQLSGRLPLTLTSSQSANDILDVFLAYNAGSPVIGTGPSWTAGGGSTTAGSCARGAGAGSTGLTKLLGVWVNSVSISLIYNTGTGNVTLTVPANQGIYLGSINVDGTAGQLSCYRTWGQSRKWGVWNAYNRFPTSLRVGDTTSSWPYNNATPRAARGIAANSLTIFSGLAEEEYNITNIAGAAVQSNSQAATGIGFNVANAYTGTTGVFQLGVGTIPQSLSPGTYLAPPSLGINTVTACESCPGGVTQTFFGTSLLMELKATWRT